MGSCNSVICAKSAVKKNGKVEKFARKEESDEVGEIPSFSTISSVSIHTGSPSSKWSCESPSSSDSSSFLSGDECDFGHPQKDAFQVRRRTRESDGRDNARNWARGRPGPSSMHSMPSTSLHHHALHSMNRCVIRNLKEKEQLAGKTLKRRPWGSVGRRNASAAKKTKCTLEKCDS